MKLIFIALVVLLFSSLALTAWQPRALAADAPPGQALVRAKCTLCHTLDRVAAKVGRVDKAWWQKTLDRMRINGAAVNDAQTGRIADYLSGLKAGNTP